MAIPVLKLNIAPPPTLWRQHHVLIGWGAIAAGILTLGGAVLATVLAYAQAASAGKNVASITARRQDVSRKQTDLRAQLESIDVEKELPRWRLAEHILVERGFPWSRLTAELERSLVQDVRIKGIQRTRDSAQRVLLKVKGEARSQTAQDDFLESLRKNSFFAETILEREASTQGGLEFDFTLPVSFSPPPYTPLPKFGPPRKSSAAPVVAATPPKPLPSPKPPTATVTRPVPRPVPTLRVNPMDAPDPRGLRQIQPRPPMSGPRMIPPPFRPANPEDPNAGPSRPGAPPMRRPMPPGNEGGQR